MKFNTKNSLKKSRLKLIVTIFVVLFVLGMASAALLIRREYQVNLRPLSQSSKTHVVTIQPGSTTAEIADLLKSKNVIRSDWAFEWYVRNHDLRDELKAGTYVVDQNQSIEEIVRVITSGMVATDLVTILPGKRLDEIKEGFKKAGFSNAEIDEALEPSQYQKHPALTDKPKDASLEGYLYPETFQKTADTTLKELVQLSLDELDDQLTPEIRQGIAKQGLSLHQGIILASIIEGEVTSPEDRAQVAQVFLKRINEGMRLESNATDDYAKIDSAYDTYKIDGLPPGPVSNFTGTAIVAVAKPAQTDWLYFVSGDDKKTHFSKTLKEHEENIQKYCTTLCGR